MCETASWRSPATPSTGNYMRRQPPDSHSINYDRSCRFFQRLDEEAGLEVETYDL